MSTDAAWFRHYDAGVPRSLHPYPERTLLDELDAAARECPERAFVLFKGTRLTYAGIAGLSRRCAAGLHALGLRRGDRIGLLLPNCPQYLIAQFAAWRLGATVVPINPLYTGAELTHPLRDTGCTLVVALSSFYEHVKAVQADTAVRQVIVANIKEHLPALLRLAFTLFVERRQGHRARLRDGDRGFVELLGTGGQALETVPPEAAGRPDEVALILMSGGTTGAPKGVIGLHRALAMSGRQLRAWYGDTRPPGADTLLLPLPLFHAYGCVAMQGFLLLARNTVALVPNPRDLKDLLRTVARTRPTLFLGVPTLFNALVNHPDVQRGRVDLSSIRMCLSGAAPLLAETRRRFEELSGTRILEGYSLTEALIAAVVTPFQGLCKPGSVGVPLPDVELRIVAAEDGTCTLPAGQTGEVLLRAPQQMPGYWGRNAESAEVLQHYDDGPAWLHTGDLGYLDEDGFLFLVDRKKDLMKPGGLQVWPREVEEVLAMHPAVSEVGVAGVQDGPRGEIVKAWVVLRAGQRADEAELRAFCKTRLAPFKVPTRVAFRSELPKSLVGKVLRRVLVAEEREQAGRESAAG